MYARSKQKSNKAPKKVHEKEGDSDRKSPSILLTFFHFPWNNCPQDKSRTSMGEGGGEIKIKKLDLTLYGTTVPALDYNIFQPTFFHLLICNQIQLLAISSFSDSISTVFCLLFWNLNKHMYVTFFHSFLTIHYIYTFDLFILISCILDWFPIPIFKGYWWTILLSLFCYLASLLNIHTINIYVSKISRGYFFNNKIISLIFLRIWNFANLKLASSCYTCLFPQM